ncbi:hypothetical protein NEOLEDRAFT_1079138, partial [Neolentinus lepideus HHB14362 ss-1]
PEGADVLEWRQTHTKQLMELLSLPDSSLDEYDDILCGDAYLDAVKSGQINDDDFVLMFSADGAQLYKNKASDFWIYIWLVIDHPPDKRYKKCHILPGAIIPGPNKPKNLDSFTFTGLHHLSALQDEGLAIWNARTQAVTLSYPFLFLALADAPGMAALNGLVGMQGQYGCHIYCGQKGRRKTNGKWYYPIRLKPHAAPPGSDHPDLPLNPPAPSHEDYERNLIILKSSVSTAQYKENCLATGICKPTIFSGLRRSLGVPGLFGLDIMHLPALNIPDLFLPLWRGSWDQHDKVKDPSSKWEWATLRDDVWMDHGRVVAANKQYLPTSFGRAPRDPAEKLHSGFKAIEFMNYFYGMGPGVFYDILPDIYWRNFCQLVYAVRILCQRKLTRHEIEDAHFALVKFEHDYEQLYYRRLEHRIPLVRPVIHTLTHLAVQTFVWGPLVCSSQWVIENAIGFLGRLVRQPSNAFANLTEVTLRHARTAALQGMVPGLVPEPKNIPKGGIDIGDSFALLPAKDRTARPVEEPAAAAVRAYLQRYDATGRFVDYNVSVHRWSKVRLPNGQLARSAWREITRMKKDARTSRNIKFQQGNQILYGEVLYYMKLDMDIPNIPPCPPHCALVWMYGNPHPTLREMSHGTLLSCLHGGHDDFLVINVKDILSVVAMIPHRPRIPDDPIIQDRFYVVEKPALAMDILGGAHEQDTD